MELSVVSDEKMELFTNSYPRSFNQAGYLGVGFLQNLSCLSVCPHAYAIIVDISEDILKYLQLIFENINQFEKRADFLSWWQNQTDKIFAQYLSKKSVSNSWLREDDLYKNIHRLVTSGNIHLINGDISNRGTHKLIEQAAINYDQSIVTSYLSNVFSPYGRLHGYMFDYNCAKQLFANPCFSKESQIFLTIEFIPEEWKKDLYHYSICSLKNFTKILEQNNTIDEFLAFYFALIMFSGQKGLSKFVSDLGDLSNIKVDTSLEEVSKYIENSSSWLPWQNFKKNFLLKKAR